MKGQVAFTPQAHKIEFHEYDVPPPPDGGIIAAVTQTNVCGSEVHMWRGEYGRRGIMPGHEMSGRIHAIGRGVTTDWAGMPIKEGDRIAPVYYTVCNRCENCVVGNHAACVNKTFGSRHPDTPPHFTATFATHYFIRPDQHFYRIPDNVPDAVASSANCAMSQVFWSLDRGRLAYGETLVVLGAGGLGLHAMAIGKARGARVVAVDAVASRLKQAKRFGADETVDMTEYPDFDARDERIRKLCCGTPDVVLEVAGVPDAFLDALKTVRAGGRVIEVGNISNALQVPVPPSLITFKSLDFLGAHIDRHPYTEMCDALFPLSKAAEAMDKSERKEVTRAGLLAEQR